MASKVIKINVIGGTCPGPLVEFKKALNKASSGDIVEVTGNHPASKKEIPMAAEDMGLGGNRYRRERRIWKIKIRK